MKYFYIVAFTILAQSISAQTIVFESPILKSILINYSLGSANYVADANGQPIDLDTNNDGEVQVSEALLVKQIIIVQNFNIQSLVGLEHFTNLEKFYFRNNAVYIDTINFFSGFDQLREVIINNSATNSGTPGGINHINFSGCSALETLSLEGNDLLSINLAGCTNLLELVIYSNLLTMLDLTSSPSITSVDANSNQLQTINIAGCSALTTLTAAFNPLTNIDFTGIHNLTTINLSMTELSTIDLSDCYVLSSLSLQINPNLTEINIKNGSNEAFLSFANCPELKYICADESQFTYVQNRISSANLDATCALSSYCNFAPGGPSYIVAGNTTWDTNNNGCDATDPVLPNLRLFVSGAAGTGAFIADQSGAYSIPLSSGTHTIMPVLTYPNYFIVVPSEKVVTFPTDISPNVTNFCVIPLGVRPDLEVTIIPLNVLRPGFDVRYQILLNNRGNIVQSGTVNFSFDDTVLDLLNSQPSPSSQNEGILTFTFTNLQPFATNIYNVTFNANSPTDTPPLNSGDVVSFSSSIDGALTDETPSDNSFVFNDTVFNSFDPNDKTCLEGNVVSPSLIGEYVHYLIRFENTGSFAAQNIVVADMINPTQFDIGTLIPLSGSHSFETRIRENLVEFIFENINLPINDANNHGFVAFKIKTKSTLVVGETFSNTASIYFDYNFPIVTNTETTTITALANLDFTFEDFIALYPNPANNTLNISKRNSINTSSYSIYNIMGQQLITIPNAINTQSIDISNLSSGTYFLKATTNKGSSSIKFIKN